MDKIYVGIDPGMSGAMAVITNEDIFGKEVFIFDYGGGDLEALKEVCTANEGIKIVALLENVHTMPKQGVVSQGKMMKNLGEWVGRLDALSISYSFVTPKTWQDKMFKDQPKIWKTVKGKKKLDTKAMSLKVARQLFPEMVSKLLRKKDADRADALLIAEYCRREGRR